MHMQTDTNIWSKPNNGAGEMAHFTKCFLHKHEDQRWALQKDGQNPSAKEGKEETSRYPVSKMMDYDRRCLLSTLT